MDLPLSRIKLKMKKSNPMLPKSELDLFQSSMTPSESNACPSTVSLTLLTGADSTALGVAIAAMAFAGSRERNMYVLDLAVESV